MQKLVLNLFAFALVVGLAQSAYATPAFNKEFKKLYASKEGSDKKESSEKKAGASGKKGAKPDFPTLVKEAKCFVCHQGKSKKDRNPYGQELDKLLGKKEKDSKKIVEALEKVAKIHTVADDKKSPTYGDLIKAGILPGGSLELAKMKPEDRKKAEMAGSDKKGADKKGSDKKGSEKKE